MTDAPEWLSGAVGPALAIGSMALATYLCRIGGVLLMSRVTLTPGVRRALAALPGSIVVATVLPITLRHGPAAIAGVLAAIVTMALVRRDLVALVVGLAVSVSLRALGV